MRRECYVRWKSRSYVEVYWWTSLGCIFFFAWGRYLLFPGRTTKLSCPELVILVLHSFVILLDGLEISPGGAPQFTSPEIHVLLDEVVELLLGRLLRPRSEVTSLQKIGVGRGGKSGKAKNWYR